MTRYHGTFHRRVAPEATVPAPASTGDGHGHSVGGSAGKGPSVRQVSPEQATAAIAAFLAAHPYEVCGEQVEIERTGRFVGLVCDGCGEERVLEVVEGQEESGGGM